MSNRSAGAHKLVVQNLAKFYGDVVALDHVTLEVREGELMTLLGPSGSGKTTLLQLIAGLVDVSVGSVIIDGEDCTTTPINSRDIGVVFQNYALFPHMTVAENVGFPLLMRKIPAQDIAKRVSEVLEMVGLSHADARFPQQLSGGQQQRVALARCLVYKPAIILMDEPFGALDAKLRETMQVEIKRIHRESGTFMIFVTHDQEEALALSDRICLMEAGRIAQIGTPQEMYDRPQNRFTADFIGRSTIFDGQVHNGAVETALGALTLPDDAHPAEGSKGCIVVRPEDIKLGQGAYCGMIVETVFNGAEQRVMLSAGGIDVTATAPARGNAFTVGEEVKFGWNTRDARYVPND
ncbi:ABC transporter ATP-binding protein [Marivita sp. S6314]|uniref:ABC transporter ATP-binding protein n=1 Tax=Marivita sp. S6314 TaxID=2926406 RepID=UPI001FF18593|nr:ABC transporter ATP-binding protein [Marivita sp. S6314]MCK0150660.1 ABC transporter ATP-binding protein [Marivita sp. S6314]